MAVSFADIDKDGYVENLLARRAHFFSPILKLKLLGPAVWSMEGLQCPSAKWWSCLDIHLPKPLRGWNRFFWGYDWNYNGGRPPFCSHISRTENLISGRMAIRLLGSLSVISQAMKNLIWSLLLILEIQLAMRLREGREELGGRWPKHSAQYDSLP